MYQSSFQFERTPEERANPVLSWNRPDRAFFASGACHILAYTFVELTKRDGLQLIFVKPSAEFGSIGTHVYVVDGDWAFDASGWVHEKELLEVLESDYKSAHPGWAYKRVVLDQDLETFCINNAHSLSASFAGDVVERAKRYIENFSINPPE